MRQRESFFRFHPNLKGFTREWVPDLIVQAYCRLCSEMIRFPKEPFEKTIEGVSARFWVRTEDDWRRIAHPEFEPEFSQALINHLKEKQGVFLNLGAAQGIYTLAAAAAGCEVVAVEPDPRLVQALKENMALNPDIEPRIQVLEMGVADQCGLSYLHCDPQRRYAASYWPTNPSLTKTIPTQMVTVDHLVFEQGVPGPATIVMDIEGWEDKALKGMERVLTEIGPDLFIEVHSGILGNFGVSEQDLVARIRGFGYHAESGSPWPRGGEIMYHFSTK